MNIYLILAGILAMAGGLAHAVLGHRWTVSPLDPAHLASDKFSGEQNRRFLMWFWHVGSVVLLSTAAILLVHGFGVTTVHRSLLLYVSFLWLSTSAVFLLVSFQPPVQFTKMPPGIVGIVINVFIILGLSFG